jgi:cytochrome c-type biogenesis protein CcmH
VKRRPLGLVTAMLLSVIFSAVSFAIDPIEMQDPALQVRYKELTHELRCMQCQDQSIADSPVGLASDLRREVRELLLAGKSNQEVRDYMVARYGDFILFRPRFSPRTAWLWLAPGVLLIVGAVIAVRIVRQRSRLVDDDDDPVEEDARVS